VITIHQRHEGRTTNVNTIVCKASKRLYMYCRRSTTATALYLHGSNPPSSRVCLPSLALFHHSRAILPTGINPKTSSTYHLQWHTWHVI